MLSVQNLHKSFRSSDSERAAVDGISFHVDRGQFFTLLGPSGCGKTTTLRSLAGLEQPDSGEISIGNSVVFSSTQGIRLPASKRAIGMVFQSYAIWPHLTVFGNVAYPLRIKRCSKSEIRQRVTSVLELVGLADLANRPAPLLSGGQQQRVALARALIAEPELLLLDEPLSNLDATLRAQMRIELKKMQARLGLTTIYVTHDQHEAMSMSDRVAVMNQGRIVQCDDPHHIYHRPANTFVAGFVGTTNLIKGEVRDLKAQEGLIQIDTPLGPVCAYADATSQLPSREVFISIRPEFAIIDETPQVQEHVNVFHGQIADIVFLGDSIEYEITVKKMLLRVKAPVIPHRRLGSDVAVRLPFEHCILICGDNMSASDVRDVPFATDRSV